MDNPDAFGTSRADLTEVCIETPGIHTVPYQGLGLLVMLMAGLGWFGLRRRREKSYQ